MQKRNLMEGYRNTILATEWSYHPYQPFLTDRGDIGITRIVPDRRRIQIFWMTEDADQVDLYWRQCGKEDYSCMVGCIGGEAEISDLEENRDYEFYLQDEEGHRSLTRLAKTGYYICTPINYLHKDDPAYSFSGLYLCSPSIVRQPDGSLLASMDLYRPGGAQNLTIIYRSDDNGVTWQWQCELFPCFWGKLFVFRDEVYMLACSTEHGDILLGKALDGGKHFTTPVVLFRGSGRVKETGPDMNPQLPIEYEGRLWINFHWGSWVYGSHHLCVASASVEENILDAANWTITPPCIYDEKWQGTAKGKSRGTLEGTFVILPDKKLYILARYEIKNCEPNYGLAILYKVRTEDPCASPEYARTISFLGNHAKFSVRRDEKEGCYYSIISRIRGSKYTSDRNLLSLVKSSDCIEWNTVMDIIDLTDKDPLQEGVQYVDFFLEDDSIYYVVRAGINGADSFHNSNTILFGIIKDFRNLKP